MSPTADVETQDKDEDDTEDEATRYATGQEEQDGANPTDRAQPSLC